jgi:hypothetical protein
MTPTISAVYHRTTGLWVKRHYALLQFTDGRTFVTRWASHGTTNRRSRKW